MADLTTTLSESVTLNGAVRGTTNTVTTTGITNVYERIVTCTTGQTTFLAAGQSHILGAAVTVMLAEADTSPSFGTMADLTSLQVSPAATLDVEIFVASV